MLSRILTRAGFAADIERGGACRLQDEQRAWLIRQATHGNVPAFERLCHRYDEAILRLLLMLTSSEQQALDLCRATFVAAYQGLAQRKTDSLYIWFYRLAAMYWLEQATQDPAFSQDLKALSPREWLVFTLKARQHLSLATVAQVLDTSAETAAQIFGRAVCKLQLSQRARFD